MRRCRNSPPPERLGCDIPLGASISGDSKGRRFPSLRSANSLPLTSPPACGRRLSRYERVAFPDGGLPVSPRRGRASCRSSPGSGAARPRRCSSWWSASSPAAGTAVSGPACGTGSRSARAAGTGRSIPGTVTSRAPISAGDVGGLRWCGIRAARRPRLASAADHRGRARPRQAGLERVAGVLAQAGSPVGGGSRPGEDPVPPRAREFAAKPALGSI
jgi:hypothetical protein